MVTAIVLSYLLAVACIVIAVLLLKGADQALAAATSLAHVPTLPPVAPSAPATATSPDAPLSRPAGSQSSPQTRIRLVSNAGRTLDEISVTKRRVSLQQRVGKARALCNFVASHKDEDDVWVYRQVGVERE